MVEGAILHHEDHDVVDVGQRPRVQRRLRILGKWLELTGRNNIINRQRLGVGGGAQRIEVSPHQPPGRHFIESVAVFRRIQRLEYLCIHGALNLARDITVRLPIHVYRYVHIDVILEPIQVQIFRIKRVNKADQIDQSVLDAEPEMQFDAEVIEINVRAVFDPHLHAVGLEMNDDLDLDGRSGKNIECDPVALDVGKMVTVNPINY